MKNRMNNKVLTLSLIALGLCLMLAALVCMDSAKTKEVYAAVPDGYSLVQNNVQYGEGYIYINTSVAPNFSTTNQNFYFEPYDGIVLDYVYYPYFRVSANYIWLIGNDGDYETTFYDRTNGWDSYIVSQLNEVRVTSISSSSSSYVNTWFYFKEYSPTPTYATSDVSITFNQSQVNSVTFDGLTWNTSGATNEITFDNDDTYYNLSVSPVSDYKAVSVSVTYSSDGVNDAPAVYALTNNAVSIPCPVGDSITSISVSSQSIYTTSSLSITWNTGIYNVYSATFDLEWTESSQSQTVTFDNQTGLYGFQPSFENGYKFDSFTFTASSASVTADWVPSAQRIVFDVPVGESINSISITSQPYLSGAFIQYAPYFTGNIVDGFEISGYSSGGSLTGVQGGLIFNNLSEIVDYFNLNYIGDRPAGNVISVLDALYNPVSYPLTIDGQLLYLEYSAYYSSVAILGGVSCVGYSQFTSATSVNDIVDLGYAYMPQYPSQSAERRIYFRHSDIIYGEPTKYAKLFFDGGYYDVAIEWDINEWAYWIVLPDNLPSNYYLNTVSYTGGLLVFNFSNTPGALGWSPGIDDALDLFALIVDGALGVLDVQIAQNMTLGTILLIVLAFGVVLFLFRISGVF